MSRYLAFVLLALSASVLAAPAELPPTPAVPAELPPMPAIPDAPDVARQFLGERSNAKVYSPSTLHKRDYLYPSSTGDCRLSEVPKGSTTRPYTHRGQAYSVQCLGHLALLVPSEKRDSCSTTGANPRSYNEECLFKKAFDEDWKFDMEKAKADELAYRSAHPTAAASDAWRYYFPTTILDCSVPRERVVRSSNGWTGYTITPDAVILDNICIARLLTVARVTVTVGTCAARAPTLSPEAINLAATVNALLGRSTTEIDARQNLAGAVNLVAGLTTAVDATVDAAVDVVGLATVDATVDAAVGVLPGRSTTELVARQNLNVSLDAAVSLLAALRMGCFLNIVVKIMSTVGINGVIAIGPIKAAVDVVVKVFDL